MLIANPIYDTIFKYLMEDTDIARKLIGLIIGEDIVELELKPQEQTYHAEKWAVQVFRMDFKATICTKVGESKQVLIELQKSKHLFDIMRFRKYLGENYSREVEVHESGGEVSPQALPIITIYFLGFSLKQVDAAVLKVNRSYLDVLTKQVLDVRNEFIEKLTHDCFVIQIPRLPDKWQGRLEKILAVFDQRYRTGDRKVLEFDENWLDDALLKQMVERLGRAILTSELRRQIDFEDEIETQLEEFARKMAKKDERTLQLEDIVSQKDQQLSEKDQQLSEKDQQIAELLVQLKKRSAAD